MKGVQCYELFGGIALKIHTFSFSFFNANDDQMTIIHNTFIVHDFCRTQSLLLFFNAMVRDIT